MSRSGGLTVSVFFCFFQHKHLVGKSFLLVKDAVCQAETRGRVGRTGERTDASPRISAVFFSS